MNHHLPVIHYLVKICVRIMLSEPWQYTETVSGSSFILRLLIPCFPWGSVIPLWAGRYPMAQTKAGDRFRTLLSSLSPNGLTCGAVGRFVGHKLTVDWWRIVQFMRPLGGVKHPRCSLYSSSTEAGKQLLIPSVVGLEPPFRCLFKQTIKQ